MKKVWINGTFDVLHAGHIMMFRIAKFLSYTNGDSVYLTVGIDSDKRIKELKGENRPINKLLFRGIILNAIKYIDKVVDFDSEEELIEQIKKSGSKILVIGEEYKNKRIVGEELFEEIIYVPKYYDLSSTQILNKNG